METIFKRKKPRKDGGLNQVLKGKPAPCHPDKVIWARSLCKNCYDKWLKGNSPEYRKRQLENCKEWSKQHKDRCKALNKKWRAKQDPLYGRIRNLRLYGMTISDYDRMLEKQNGGCAICGNPPKDGKNLHVDHNHDTGYVRGLLCFRCNFGLSYFDGNVKTIENLYKYLTKKC
jgi:hypothetical protein